MIERYLKSRIVQKLDKGKAIVLVGARQVGKTTLLQSILEIREHVFLNGDDPTVRWLLTNPNTEQLRSLIGSHKIVFLDEAQRIENIGLTLKLITDHFRHVQLLVSGSSAFEINNHINEPLTGRKWELKLFPISWDELENQIGFLTSEQQLPLRLLYGMYPDVINNPGNEVDILKELTDSYLFRDILSLGGIRKPRVLESLVQALALQIGNEVSYNELAQLIGVDKNTIGNYIDLLEKGYVVFRLKSFSRNLRNEIKTNQKVYFYDTGIRNAIIGNFNPVDSRIDLGGLWENFLIAERLKILSYHGSLAKSFFWRTKQQQEIDYVEADQEKVKGFEFKWNPKARVKYPKSFIQSYKADLDVVHRENFREFLSIQ